MLYSFSESSNLTQKYHGDSFLTMADFTSTTLGIKPMIFNAGTTLGATSFDDFIFNIKSICAMKSKKHAQIFDENVDDFNIDQEVS